MIDPYSTLGVGKNATDAEIKSAYRRLAKQWHPDAGGDETKFATKTWMKANALLTTLQRTIFQDCRLCPQFGNFPPSSMFCVLVHHRWQIGRR